jgi:hypothetical protein
MQLHLAVSWSWVDVMQVAACSVLTLVVWASKGVSASQHDVQHDATAPDVCDLSIIACLASDIEQHLGGHVGQCADLRGSMKAGGKQAVHKASRGASQ